MINMLNMRTSLDKEFRPTKGITIESRTPRMDAKFKKIWVESLRNPTVPQSTRSLYVVSEENSFGVPVGQCCLGNFTEACINNGLVELDFSDIRGLRQYGEEMNSGTLPLEVGRAAWGDNYGEYNSDGRIELFRVLVDGEWSVSEIHFLTVLNDSVRLTFSQIADLVDYFL